MYDTSPFQTRTVFNKITSIGDRMIYCSHMAIHHLKCFTLSRSSQKRERERSANSFSNRKVEDLWTTLTFERGKSH